MDYDANARIAAAAAEYKGSGITVKGVERKVRDPNRHIRIVKLGIPVCDVYPAGTELWVHPRQVDAHIKLYPGAWIIREITNGRVSRADPHAMTPKGHTRPQDIAPHLTHHPTKS